MRSARRCREISLHRTVFVRTTRLFSSSGVGILWFLPLTCTPSRNTLQVYHLSRLDTWTNISERGVGRPFITMLPSALWLLCLAALSSRAQDTTDYVSVTGTLSTASVAPTSAFTGSEFTYLTSTGQSTISSLAIISGTLNTSSTMASGNASDSQMTRSTTSQSITAIVGGGGATSSGAAGGTRTSSAALASNTVPCNNYPEFCNRKYSNITEVCAHNSAFSTKNNAFSNQQLSITQQLNDGIRMRKSHLPCTDKSEPKLTRRQSRARHTG